MERAELAAFVKAKQMDLRIKDWFIELTEKPELETCFVSCNAQGRTAEVFYNPKDPMLRFHITHELVHVLLYDMAYLACDGRTPELMNAYTYLEERVCDVVAANIY